MKRRGLSLIEILVASAIALLSFVTFLSVFSKSYEQASLTRDQAIAAQLAQTWIAEIDAHPYGERAPQSWADGDERPANLEIDGKPVDLVYHRTLRYKTSDFIGNRPSDANSPQGSDAVTVTLTWTEKSGPKELVVVVPVWR